MTRTARSRRMGATAVSAAALLSIVVAGTLALTRISLPPAVVHGGTESYLVEAVVPATAGCGPLELRISARDDAIEPLEAVTVSAAMPTMGHIAGEVTATAPRGTIRIEGMCLSMAGPWEVNVELRSGVRVERLLMPLEIVG